VLVIVVDSFDVATIMKWIVKQYFKKYFPGLLPAGQRVQFIVEKKEPLASWFRFWIGRESVIMSKK